MKISNRLSKRYLAFFTLMLILFTAGVTLAQTDTVKKKRLKSPAIAKSVIGGESHDSYVIRVRKNQTLSVQISWKAKDDNKAEFFISKSSNFYSAEPIKDGKETNNGKMMVVKIRATGDYYIYVTAHPTANYTLKVSAK